jgi:xanthine dehydrogenase small subunit
MPALIALGATLTLRKGNSRRVLDLEDFFLGYQKNALDRGEFLEAIRIPRLSPRTQFRTCKISKRFDQDISALCGALAVTLDRGRVSAARIAFGGLAAVPRRAYATEAALSGAAWSAQSVERSAQCLSQDFTPITDMRASAEYRLRVARNLLHKFYLEVEQGEPLRLYALEATNS